MSSKIRTLCEECTVHHKLNSPVCCLYIHIYTLYLLVFYFTNNLFSSFFPIMTGILLTYITNSHHMTGDIVSLFSGSDYSSQHSMVDFRVKKLAFTCIEAIHQNRLYIYTYNFFSVISHFVEHIQAIASLYQTVINCHFLFSSVIDIFSFASFWFESSGTV